MWGLSAARHVSHQEEGGKGFGVSPTSGFPSEPDSLCRAVDLSVQCGAGL